MTISPPNADHQRRLQRILLLNVLNLTPMHAHVMLAVRVAVSVGAHVSDHLEVVTRIRYTRCNIK